MKRLAHAFVIAARSALAQSPELTREFNAGVDAYRLGKLGEARTHLEKARAMDPKLPGPHRFLGAVAQAQGKWSECIDEARSALALNPRSAEVMDTRKLVEACRVSAGRSPYRQELGDSAAIGVTTNVAGATVKINGLVYGGTPIAPRPITAGTLDVEIEKQGWKPNKITIDALPGVVTDVIVDLEPDTAAQSGRGIGTGDDGHRFTVGYLLVSPGVGNVRIDGAPMTRTERIELSPGTHVVEIAQPGKDLWRRRVRIGAGQNTTLAPALVDTAAREHDGRVGWYVISGGGALLLGGFVTAMLSRRAADDARDIVRVERSRDPSRPLAETAAIAPVRTRDDLQDARDRAQRWAVISDVTYAAGLVTAGVGAYLLFRGERERTDGSPPFAIAPMRGGVLVATETAW